MEIEHLLEDLSSRLDAQARVELAQELAEILEAERAELTLAGRLAAAVGQEVMVSARDEGSFRGIVNSVTRHYVHLNSGLQQVYVALGALCTVQGLPPAGQLPAGARANQSLASVLRQAARAGARVVVGCQGVRAGQVAFVGKDFIDLAPAPGSAMPPATIHLQAVSWVSIG